MIATLRSIPGDWLRAGQDVPPVVVASNGALASTPPGAPSGLRLFSNATPQVVGLELARPGAAPPPPSYPLPMRGWRPPGSTPPGYVGPSPGYPPAGDNVDAESSCPDGRKRTRSPEFEARWAFASGQVTATPSAAKPSWC